MTGRTESPAPPSVLVVGHGPVAASAAREIASAAGDSLVVHRADGADAAARLVSSLTETSAAPEVVVATDLDTHTPDEVLAAVIAASGTADAPPRLLVVTAQTSVPGLDRSVEAGLLDGVVGVPWAPGELGPRILARWSRLEAERLRDEAGEPERAALHDRGGPADPPGADPHARGLMPALRGSRRTAVTELVAALEEALGPRPRVALPAGVTLSRRGSRLEGLYVLLRGEAEVILPGGPGNRAAAGMPEGTENPFRGGPLIGLPGFVGDRSSLHTIRSLTDCEVVHLSEEQLVAALTRSRRVGVALGVVAIHGLDDRLRHAETQRRTEAELAARLHSEGERLADALDALAEARVELMSQASSAAIGQMAAGLFHELNNPLAALEGARDHLLADLEQLVGRGPDADLLTRALRRARGAPTRSTPELRAARRRVRAVLPDAETARRVVAAGLDDDESLAALARASRGTRDAVVSAAAVGSAARNLDLAVGHISDLVSSLRSSMRPVDADFVPTDVADTLDDALRITGHRLTSVRVERSVAADLPEVTAHPGQLTQVWINLLTNAADVLTGPDAPTDPAVRVDAARTADGGVAVTVVDNGPGVPEDVRTRIFEPRFTTKSGRIRFGLGMGLGISRRIVQDHEGVIELDSRPGRTAFRVVLPAADHTEEPLG